MTQPNETELNRILSEEASRLHLSDSGLGRLFEVRELSQKLICLSESDFKAIQIFTNSIVQKSNKEQEKFINSKKMAQSTQKLQKTLEPDETNN